MRRRHRLFRIVAENAGVGTGRLQVALFGGRTLFDARKKFQLALLDPWVNVKRLQRWWYVLLHM